MKVSADQLDDTRNIRGIHPGVFGIFHQVDHPSETHLIHHGPYRILNLHGKCLIVGFQRLIGV